MWLVPKGATNAKGKEPLAAALRDTLRIWYTGKGNHLDEQTALVLVRHARKTGCWIACECQGEAATPMLSPALLTGADTYYLRRLTGRRRKEHSPDCPFYREQTFTTLKSDRQPARSPPDGFFAALTPPATSLAQEPDDDASLWDSASHGAPRLAKLMWRLLELSGRTVIDAREDTQRDIAGEFKAVRALAERIEVAPQIPLSRVLFTHPRDWESRRIFAILRELSKSWPKGHEPQAFLLVFAHKIREHSIETSDGTINLATRLRHPGTRARPISGPNLTLVAIGDHPDGHGYGALRAWAQPVYNGHRFIPVDTNFDREIIEAVIAARRILVNHGVAVSARKPLFDLLTPDGAVRPCWTVTLQGSEGRLDIMLETPHQNDDEGRRAKALQHLGPILLVDQRTISRLTVALRELWQEITTSLETSYRL